MDERAEGAMEVSRKRGGLVRHAAATWVLLGVVAFASTAQASTGEFERAWGKDVTLGGSSGFEVCAAAATCTAGISGGLGGELKTPQGLTADGAGNIYVADYSNNRIQVFDS